MCIRDSPYTADELIDRALKYRAYWGSKGGITVSGGEPLLQIDFLLELFKRARQKGIHTTLDTSGNPFTKKEPFFGKFQKLMEYTDLVLLDIKPVSYTHLHGALLSVRLRDDRALPDGDVYDDEDCQHAVSG